MNEYLEFCENIFKDFVNSNHTSLKTFEMDARPEPY